MNMAEQRSGHHRTHRVGRPRLTCEQILEIEKVILHCSERRLYVKKASFEGIGAFVCRAFAAGEPGLLSAPSQCCW